MKERKKLENNRINTIIENSFNNKNSYKNEEEKISDISFLGSFLMNSIIEEKKINPNNFFDTKKYTQENKIIFPLFVVSN